MKQDILNLVFVLITLIQIVLPQKEPFTCSSIEIYNEKDLTKLQNCIKIEGHVQITNVRLSNTTRILAPIEEITDYLLVYRVEGLQSLEGIFPNLTIIRGHNLLFNRYSLIVYENREIRNIGLKSLLKIRNGQIKIASNPVLCYTDTVNWIYLVENHSVQHFSLKDNQYPNECPKCVKVTEFDGQNKKNDINKISASKYFKFNCWNKDNYQLKKPVPRTTDCPAECEERGCTEDGKCCSPLCLSGCLAENCRICKDFRNLQRNCVATCNFPFYKLGDKCITSKDCQKMQYIPHADSCIEFCPQSYQKEFYFGVPQCSLKCKGNFTIRSRKDLKNVTDCVTIQGSLTIELKEDHSENIIQDLENVLGGVKEITDFLKVTKSPQIMSLGFLKRLDTIKGENLINGEIALYVVENLHLEEIWPDNHKIAILKGRLFFHLNPRLCYDKILQLAPSVRSLDEISARDASHNSNGERAICGSEVKQMNATIEATNATAARVKLDTLSSSDRTAVLGYLFYYKEAPIKNVTMFDGRHGCGRDNWKMDMKLNPNVRHVFSNLKPNTQYAYFVKTFSSVENNYLKQDWYSAIQYFKTNSSKPGPVQKIFSVQIAKTAVIIHWWPPKNANGVIEKYLIRSELIDHHLRYSQMFGYTQDKETSDCECNIKQQIRGPPPSDLDYFSREKAIYDAAIMNFVYVSVNHLNKIDLEIKEEDKTRRKRGTQQIILNNELITTTTEEITKDTKKTNSSESQEMATNESETEIKLKKHFDEVERLSVLEQDTGIEDFLIIQPINVCAVNLTKNSQNQHNCTPLEIYEGTEIPGTVHSYILEDLLPEKIYQVFIRACVEGIPNECGSEKSIEVETHIKKFESKQPDPDSDTES